MRVTSRSEAHVDSRLGSSGLIALVAFLVSAFVFGAVLIGLVAWESGQAEIRRAKEDARSVIDRADTDLRHDLRALTAVAKRISGAPINQPRPAPGSVAFNAELFPQWIGSMIWSLDTGQTVFSSLPGEDIPAPSPAWVEELQGKTEPVIGGIQTIAGQIGVVVHIPVPDDPRRLVLTTAIRPEPFQDILQRRASEDGVSALVDRAGNFIARSRDFANRVGTPATSYVLDAVRRGGEGDYRGRTWEGLDNFSAYYTSSLSGWSAHIAIEDDLVDASVPWATWLAIGGGLFSLVLAGGLVWLIQRDSRRRQYAERSMANARRVETLGRLTGGIAHDFNNLLTVIIGSLERGKKRSADVSSSKEVGLALEAARRAASLTRSLMLYSRPQAADAQTLDLNACVRDSAEMIRRTLGAAYEVELDLQDGVGNVRTDSAQLASALLNLAVNARDAMPAGGAIVLRTTRKSITRKDAHTGLPPGDYLEVSVSDNGPGMPPDVARRAFDPFFTTKDVGKGTGLGLVQVDAFARQFAGIAELDTSPGKGTRVTLTFPLAGEIAPKAAAAAVDTTVPKGLKVLVVEDEPGVREHASALLSELGCEVVSCADANEAFGALQSRGFDLLFSDIVLPGGRSGVDIAEHVQQHFPDMRIILATGYAGNELDGKTERWPLLHKPYDLPQLSAMIAATQTAKAPQT